MPYKKFFDIYPFNQAIDLAFKSAKIKTDKVIYGANQWTYKFWLMSKDRYHYFGNYRVYYAYRWSVAEMLDEIGCIKGTANPSTATEKDIVHSNYAARYIKKPTT